MIFTMDKIFRRYGSQLILRRGDQEKTFRGFLQHSGSKSWQNMEDVYCPLGEMPRGQYVLLVPMEPQIAVGDTLIQGSLKVVVRRIETVMAGDKSLYRWGLCLEKGSEDLWGSQS